MSKMITYDNKEITYTGCPGCAFAAHQFGLTSGMIYENPHLTLAQDWELPIPGFLIVSPKKHIEKLTELTQLEINELFEIVNKTIAILRENQICDSFNVIFEEKEQRHFHIWIMPRYKWMNDLVKEITYHIEDIFNYAKTNLKNKESYQKIKEISDLVKKELNKSAETKYVRVMDENISNASGLEFKINEINECQEWHPEETDRDKTGGINFSNEENILRWIRRGDTLYDVELPEDAEMIKVPGTFTPNGLFRANKVIVKNPRKLDENIIAELYAKSRLPENTYYTVLGILAQKGYEKTCFELIKDKINKNNIKEALKTYENYAEEHNDVKENPGLYFPFLEILKEMNKKNNS